MRTFAALCLTIVLSVAHAARDDQFADVAVKAIPVGGSVYMLTGAGGNAAVSIGKDGTLLVDDQYAALAPRIQSAITQLGGTAPKLIVNTHFDPDHTGGNVFFAERAVIIAAEQVRYRLLNDPATARAALPVVTFADRIRLQFNNDEIDVIHFPNGHTDGDSVVWFRAANVLHTGGLFPNSGFPYIDFDNGGSVQGYLDAVAQMLDMVPADTRIIPGHGPLASVVELGEFQDMLKATVSNIRARIAAGESVDAIVAAGLGPQWASYATGAINEERWIRTVQGSATPVEGGRRR